MITLRRFEISPANQYQAALETDEFDTVVLDLMLPDGSGLDLLTSLRAKGDRIPVLLLTALDEVPDRTKGLDAGADDYVGKPFDLDEWTNSRRVSARSAAGSKAEHRLTCPTTE